MYIILCAYHENTLSSVIQSTYCKLKNSVSKSRYLTIYRATTCNIINNMFIIHNNKNISLYFRKEKYLAIFYDFLIIVLLSNDVQEYLGSVEIILN